VGWVLYRLAPKPEFRIQVPPNHLPGDSVTFTREDGVGVSVPVPPGMQPGEMFEVTPPVLMVRVPEGATPGTRLIFHRQGCGPPEETREWIRCEVPAGVAPGKYFAARIPKPGQQFRRTHQWV